MAPRNPSRALAPTGKAKAAKRHNTLAAKKSVETPLTRTKTSSFNSLLKQATHNNHNKHSKATPENEAFSLLAPSGQENANLAFESTSHTPKQNLTVLESRAASTNRSLDKRHKSPPVLHGRISKFHDRSPLEVLNKEAVKEYDRKKAVPLTTDNHRKETKTSKSEHPLYLDFKDELAAYVQHVNETALETISTTYDKLIENLHTAKESSSQTHRTHATLMHKIFGSIAEDELKIFLKAEQTHMQVTLKSRIGGFNEVVTKETQALKELKQEWTEVTANLLAVRKSLEAIRDGKGSDSCEYVSRLEEINREFDEKKNSRLNRLDEDLAKLNVKAKANEKAYQDGLTKRRSTIMGMMSEMEADDEDNEGSE